jgi:hypothetical protein
MKCSGKHIIEVPSGYQELVLKKIEAAKLNPDIMFDHDEASKVLKS